MQTDKKLTPSDLALYFGQKAAMSWQQIPGVTKRPIDGYVLTEYGYKVEWVKPLLRPLSDITEEEVRRCYRLFYGEGYDWSARFGGDSCMAEWWENRATADDFRYKILIGHPAIWAYLLSIGIDLFDWIPAGLAIDMANPS